MIEKRESTNTKMFVLKRVAEIALVVDAYLIIANLLQGDPAKAWSHTQYAVWWAIVRWHWL